MGYGLNGMYGLLAVGFGVPNLENEEKRTS
jgi:hypothetical protein